MKRIGNLYAKIISIENLRLADEKARRGKLKSYGVMVHDRNRERNIIALHDALLTKTYRTSAYHVFKVYKPKEREIYRLPYYPDRIVHHAIMNVLEPIWVSVFTHNTYSCIKKRGIDGCARQVERIIRKYDGRCLYCLKIDIVKFYPSIDHDILKGIVRRKIKDNDLLWLLDDIIDSVDGLPIGNYLSQYLANLYLSYFMHYVNEELHVDVTEYADDMVFFSDSKDVLHDVLDFTKKYFSESLHVNVKGNYQIFPVSESVYDRSGRSIDYVGYRFFRNQKLIRKNIKKNLCRVVSGLNKNGVSYKEYKMAIAPWIGWAKHSDSINLFKSIIQDKQYYGKLRQEALHAGGGRKRKLSVPFRYKRGERGLVGTRRECEALGMP